jgi:hypothetical protein
MVFFFFFFLSEFFLSSSRFHVDDLPSPHAYVRLEKGKTIDDIPEDVLEDCCQLVKNGSFQGTVG